MESLTGEVSILGRASGPLQRCTKSWWTSLNGLYCIISQGTARTISVIQNGPEALDLSRLELRYWLRTGEAIDTEQQAVVDSANPRAAYILADVVPTNRGSQDYYLRVRFAPGAGAVGRYQRSEEIAVRFPRTGWTNHALAGDYSFAGVPERPDSFREWDRATLYLDGRLVWGTEP